jgi:carbon-monoxide dehydrogenase medium subunit
MFASEFDYYRAGSVAEAGELLSKHPGSKLLAGGHSLIPVLKLRLGAPTALVDIGRIEALRGIAVDAGTIRIGALTTHAELAASETLNVHATALAEAAGMIGDPAVRNRGTIGGNVAHADPASDLPQVLACLGAQFSIAGAGGARAVAAADFFEGLMTTAVQENEILTSIELPAAGSGEGSAYAKFGHPASRYAVIGAAAKVTVRDGACAAASVALGGLVAAPVRAEAVEQALVGQELTESAIEAASRHTADALADDEVLGDLYASAEYRKAVAHIWVRRALAAAASRSG